MPSKEDARPAEPAAPSDTSPELAELLQRLADPDPNIQIGAYYRLDTMNWGDKAEEIFDALIKAPPPVSVFLERLWHDDPKVREHAIRHVASHGDKSKEIIDNLTRLLGDSNSEVRGTAAFYLGGLGPAAWPAIPALFALATMPLPLYYDPKINRGRDAARDAIAKLLGIANIDFDKFRDYKELINSLKGQGSPVPSLEEVEKPTHAQYAALSQELVGESHRFREELARRLEPSLNARIQETPHETYEEKKALARWVNEQLEPLGLAVKEPKTGLPGKLRAQAGNWRGIGRFAIEIYTDGKQKTPTVSDQLPELTLMDATPPQQAEGKWQEAVGPKESRRGRVRT